MIDSFLRSARRRTCRPFLRIWGFGEEQVTKLGVARYALLTLHRPSNVDTREGFLGILDGLEELAADYPIVFPVHPRTRQRIKEFGLESRMGMNKAKGNSAFAPGSVSTQKGIILTDPSWIFGFSLFDEKCSDRGHRFRRHSGRNNLPGDSLRHGTRKTPKGR